MYTTSNRAIGKIQVPRNATVKDIKAAVAGRNPKLPIERQSLRCDLKDKDKKDTLTINDLGLTSNSRVYIKDLGPQISWKTVFILEYLGPLVVYAIFASRPRIIYGEKAHQFEFSMSAS